MLISRVLTLHFPSNQLILDRALSVVGHVRVTCTLYIIYYVNLIYKHSRIKYICGPASVKKYMAKMCGKTKAVNGGLYIGAPHGDICTVAN